MAAGTLTETFRAVITRKAGAGGGCGSGQQAGGRGESSAKWQHNSDISAAHGREINLLTAVAGASVVDLGDVCDGKHTQIHTC